MLNSLQSGTQAEKQAGPTGEKYGFQRGPFK